MAVRLGIGLNVRFEMEALAPQKALALAGVAQIFASPMAVREEVAAGLLCAAPLSTPRLTRTLYLAEPRERPGSIAARHLAVAVREEAAIWQQAGDFSPAQPA